MEINGVEIEDTFAEGFKMWGARVIITGKNRKWALEAATKMTGFATSVIGCKCEAGIEGEVTDTPDGRPGFSVLLFTPSKDDLPKRLMERIHTGFGPGDDLTARLDGSTPFRRPEAANSIRLRSWAIHDGLLGEPFTNVTMYKRLGKHAGVSTTSDCEW